MSYFYSATTDRISTGSLTISQTTGSVSLWYKPTYAQANGVTSFVFAIRNGDNYQFHVGKGSDNSLYAGWYTNVVDYRLVVLNANYTLIQNSWNFLVMTWSYLGGTRNLYLNNTQISSSGAGFNVWDTGTPGKSFFIGNDLASDNVTYQGDARGYITDLAIYNYILSAGDQSSLYAGALPTTLTAGTHYWSLRGTLADAWGSNTGTATGAAPNTNNPFGSSGSNVVGGFGLLSVGS